MLLLSVHFMPVWLYTKKSFKSSNSVVFLGNSTRCRSTLAAWILHLNGLWLDLNWEDLSSPHNGPWHHPPQYTGWLLPPTPIPSVMEQVWTENKINCLGEMPWSSPHPPWVLIYTWFVAPTLYILMNASHEFLILIAITLFFWKLEIQHWLACVFSF